VSAERRYPSDLTDRQWEFVASLLPERPSGPAGRRPSHEKREIVNAILYLTRTDCGNEAVERSPDLHAHRARDG
jgi:putative transposase